jgi:hypothetical protein
VNRALVTFANGTHQELLEIAMPSFQAFADRHGYEIVQPNMQCSRPTSWWKVPALQACLDEGYEEALWVDADMVIVDPTDDLDVPADSWQALVRHHTGDGEVPNCGLWFVRKPMRDWLEKVWAFPADLPWWEQTALMRLLGYQPDPRPAFLVEPTVLYHHTHWLDNGWNCHTWDTPAAGHPRVQHATMWPDRAAVMREWAEAA